MDRLEKVAIPPMAATVRVPARVPAPGLVPTAVGTLRVVGGARLPLASLSWTVTAGAMAAPATVLDGCPTKASLLAAPGVMVNVVLVAPPSAPSTTERVYPAPVLLIDRLEKVASPLTAATVKVPDSVPPLGLV